VPYHDGAIRYFKEVDAWSDTAQGANASLYRRQEALTAAWESDQGSITLSDWEVRWSGHAARALKRWRVLPSFSKPEPKLMGADRLCRPVLAIPLPPGIPQTKRAHL